LPGGTQGGAAWAALTGVSAAQAASSGFFKAIMLSLKMACDAVASFL